MIAAERFVVRRGASGRRYVFTRIEALDAAEDLSETVVMIRGRHGGAETVAFALGGGEAGPGPGEIWAHYLARTAGARQAALADLLAATGVETRVARAA
ncbi:MAG: hypothetical protein ABTQ29_14410 [Siculibacillus sp.]